MEAVKPLAEKEQYTNEKENWTTVLKPRTGWSNINVGEIWEYRDLIRLFIRRDFVANYKQTVLGPLWFVLQPLFTMAIYTVIFGLVARIPTDDMPRALFYLAGIITWNYFSSCLTKTSDTFITNSAIFGKVYFPRLVIPISVVITNIISFSIQFCLFLLVFCYYYLKGSPLNPNIWVIYIPLLLLQMAALGLGVGLLVSSMTTRYRDLSFALGFGIQLWMYATPVIYPMSVIPAKWHWIFILNPMTSVVTTFRHAFLGGDGISPLQMLISLGMTLLLLLAGILSFKRVEKTFVDTV